MKTEERKRVERAKFKEYDDEFIGLFGFRTHKFLVEAAKISSVDLREWSLRIQNQGVNAHIDPTKKEFVVYRGIVSLSNPLRKFVLLHELGHLIQANKKRLTFGKYGPIWDNKTVMITFNPTAREYAARPWERDASDFAMNHPLFEKVQPNDFGGMQGELLDTFKEHLKIPRIV